MDQFWVPEADRTVPERRRWHNVDLSLNPGIYMHRPSPLETTEPPTTRVPAAHRANHAHHAYNQRIQGLHQPSVPTTRDPIEALFSYDLSGRDLMAEWNPSEAAGANGSTIENSMSRIPPSWKNSLPTRGVLQETRVSD
ncbi:hypothetical protein N7466_003804 [Penicillium verhagenii]|uniref:uncharacterized protein n=1 Tax=Penicillium verhagenii TaxID=1562060 RepID=UPI0025453E06|nr:uncharacterized protein N7466_003804 [Penicillium verhagenii]KAJ5934257.1 hypothetical protein N7466_003804 [Penicillium verhagenii]